MGHLVPLDETIHRPCNFTSAAVEDGLGVGGNPGACLTTDRPQSHGGRPPRGMCAR